VDGHRNVAFVRNLSSDLSSLSFCFHASALERGNVNPAHRFRAYLHRL
jgi:hypothetical protein